MVMRQCPVGRERPGERLALPGDLRDQSAVSGRVTRTVAVALVTTAAMAILPSTTFAGPPPGRAYELVSPADDLGGAPAGVATDSRPLPGLAPAVGDERVIYGAVSSIGETESGATNPLIFGRRTSTGWRAVTGLRTTDGGETALGFNTSDMNKAWTNEQGTALAFMVSNSLGLPQPDTGGQVFQSVYRMGEHGPPEWLSGPAPGARLNTVSIPQEMVASRDLQTVAFQSSEPLTPDGPPAGQSGVYARRNGQLQLASVLPNGDLPTGGATFANPYSGATSQSNPPALALRNLLTRDGRYLVFKVANASQVVPSAALYVRDLEQGTTRVLAPPSGPAAVFGSLAGLDTNQPWIPGGNASPSPITMPLGYVAVASNAPIAFFRSGANLAPGATGSDYDKVYQADLATGKLTYRPEIDGPPVELSADGRKVMFLRPTGDSRADPWELRFWDADAPNESALVGSIAGANNRTYNANGLVRSFRSSTDGKTWVFTAPDALDPTHPNAATATLQVYRWRIGDSHPTCLSCAPVDGQVRFVGAALSQGEARSTESIRKPNGDLVSTRKYAVAQRSRAISDNGRLVAFDSPDRLLPDDTNDVRDVYLWDADAPAGAHLQLVTSGQGTAPSYYIDISPDGRNVFFSTQDGLVPADQDITYDVYVARRGGGFPGSPESCVGQGCRPPVIVPSPPVVPASPWPVPVTVGATRLLPPAKQHEAVKLRVRKGKATRRRITLKVRTPGPGKIRVRGKGLRHERRTAKRSTTYHVHVRLSKHARHVLRKRGRVRVRARVRFTPEQGKAVKKTVKWTIKRGTRSSRKGR